MTIPDKVKIGWRDYEVKQSENKTAADGNELLGQIDYDYNKIYIWEKQPEEIKPCTLLHEILHGIFFISGHDEWRTNEELVECITENLYQVIKDNPEVFK
jgi:Zn-dependent peptidase ImmA (M78 family)